MLHGRVHIGCAALVVAAALASWPVAADATTLSEFATPTPNSIPYDITTGPDANLWFTEGVTQGDVGRITTAGTITEFPLLNCDGCKPQGITAAGGDLWIADQGQNRIVRITTAGVLVEEFGTSQPPIHIAAGPNGQVWATEETGNALARVSPGGNPPLAEFGPASSPGGIALGADGALWFAEAAETSGTIGRIPADANVDTIIGHYPGATGIPYDIAAGPDGALWFTEPGANLIGRITTGGFITEFPLPAGSTPRDITARFDGLYFSEQGDGQGVGAGPAIGRITTAGVISHYPLATSPLGITGGPDGGIWFTEPNTSKIGRLLLTPPDTAITVIPNSNSTDTTPTFAFSTGEPNARFQCRVGSAAFAPCTSPFTTQPLAAGSYVFQVRAVSFAGVPDTSPASFAFTVALPPPVLGKTFNVEPVSGDVYVSLPAGATLSARSAAYKSPIKGRRFIPLSQAHQVPVGSFVDVRKGTARITTARDAKGTPQPGNFGGGVFQLLQSGKTSQKGLSELRLKGSSFKNCKVKSRKSNAQAARKTKRKVRSLRGNAKGRFRTRGRYSAATVRGTRWTTTDRCDGTLTSVQSGKVDVNDFRRHKTIHLRTGKRYLAKGPK